MKTFLFLLLCGVILVSCAPPAPDVAQVRKEIEAITEKAEKDLMAGIMDTTLAIYRRRRFPSEQRADDAREAENPRAYDPDDGDGD